MYYVTPSEDEIFLRYNPELQKRSLENRAGTQKDFDEFVMRLKKYSKSDKPIWEEVARAERQDKDGKILEQRKLVAEIARRKEEMRRDGVKAVPGGSL